MTEPTIEVSGETFDAESVHEATNRALDGDNTVHRGAVQVGDIVVHGDGCVDADGHIVDVEQGVSTRLTDLSDVREKADKAVELPFEQYLTEEVFTRGGYTFESHYGGDIKVAECGDGTGYVIPEDLDRAIEDHNVELYAIKDGWLVVKDERDS